MMILFDPFRVVGKTKRLCYNNMTPSGSGRDVVLQDPGGENVIYLNPFGFLPSMQMTAIHSGYCNSFRFTPWPQQGQIFIEN